MDSFTKFVSAITLLMALLFGIYLVIIKGLLKEKKLIDETKQNIQNARERDTLKQKIKENGKRKNNQRKI